MTTPFLLLRGAPGVGKSTVAALLRSHYPQGLTIEVDTLRSMVHANPWGSPEHHQNAVEAAAVLAAHYQALGYHPIHIVDATATLPGIPMITLIASDEALTARLTQRQNHGFKDIPTSLSINLKLAAESLPHNTIIDTTDLTAELAAIQILAITRSN